MDDRSSDVLENADRLCREAARLLPTHPDRSAGVSCEGLEMLAPGVEDTLRAQLLATNGLALARLGRHTGAIERFREALGLYRGSGDADGEARMLSNLGNALRNLGSYESALSCHLEALDLLEERQNQAEIAKCQHNIGNTYLATRDWDEAIRHYRRSLELDPDDQTRSATLNSLAKVYQAKGDLASARECLDTALSLKKNAGHLLGVGIVNHNLGNLLAEMGLMEEAVACLRESLAISEQLGEKRGIALGCVDLGALWLRMGDPDEAWEYLVRGEAVAREIDLKDALIAAYHTMSRLTEGKGDLVRALDYHRHYAALREELDTSRQMKRLEEVQARHDLEKSERENEIYRLRYSELASAHEALKNAQEEIIGLERRNSVAATMVTLSHEINQPLMVISGSLELLRQLLDAPLSQGAERCLERIGQSVEKVVAVLDQLRSLQRVEYTPYTDDEDMIELKPDR